MIQVDVCKRRNADHINGCLVTLGTLEPAFCEKGRLFLRLSSAPDGEHGTRMTPRRRIGAKGRDHRKIRYMEGS